VIQHYYKILTLLFSIATLVLFKCQLFKKNNKNIQITKKFTKNIFIINLGSKTKWSHFQFISLIKIPNQLNHISSHFFFQYKKYKPILICHLALYFKTFFKTNKKHKTNQTVIFTPNYEVLIPHGYVGKWPSHFESIKNVDNKLLSFL